MQLYGSQKGKKPPKKFDASHHYLNLAFLGHQFHFLSLGIIL